MDTDGDGKPDDWLPGKTSAGPVLDDDDDNDGVPDALDPAPKDSSVLPAPKWYVDLRPVPPSGTIGSTPIRDGSKALPFATIQDALTAAVNSDVIQVERGIYTGTGNHSLTFGGKRVILVALRGPEETIIDCAGAGAGSHAFSFANAAENESARVVGFTIRNAPASAIYCENASPVIYNCVLTNNAIGATAGNGGGFHLVNSSPTILNCPVVNNGNTSAEGGGLYASGTSAPRVSHCTFKGNARANNKGQIHARDTAKVTLQNTLVWSSATDSEIAKIGSGMVTANYCSVRGGYTGLFNQNLAADPALEGVGRLTRTSPPKDRGTTNSIAGYGWVTRFDCDGEARLQDFPANILFSADIGADEFVYRIAFPTVDETRKSLAEGGEVVESTVTASEVDEASGVAYLGNDLNGRAVLAVIDDEREQDFRLYTLNDAGDGMMNPGTSILTLNSPKYTGAQSQVMDLEGITTDFATPPTLYLVTSHTRARQHRGVEHTLIDPLRLVKTNDYDRRRNMIVKVAMSADLTSAASMTFYEPEPRLFPTNVYFNPARGLIGNIRTSLNQAPYRPRSLGTSVLIAWNTMRKFGVPVNGTAYAAGTQIPGGGTSLGTKASAVSTYVHTSLTPNTHYHYKMWIVGTGNVYHEFLEASASTRGYPDLYINEVLAESTNPGQINDWIEIYNPTTVNISVLPGLSGGFSLSGERESWAL